MQSAVVEVVPCILYLSVSRLTYCLRTTSAPFARGDSRFSLIEETDYQKEQFAVIHPGGAVGDRLTGGKGV